MNNTHAEFRDTSLAYNTHVLVFFPRVFFLNYTGADYGAMKTDVAGKLNVYY